MNCFSGSIDFLLKTFQSIASILIFITYTYFLTPPLISSLPDSSSTADSISTTSPTSTTSASVQPRFTPSPWPSSSPRHHPLYPSPTIVPTNIHENYHIEPDPDGKEGFYVMKSIPDEHMSSVDELNQAVNQYRSNHHLQVLYIDPQLCEIATARAIEIDSEFSHDQFSSHVNAGDYYYTGYNAIGENLWQGQFSGVHIVEFGWDRTVGHRANLQGDWSRGCAGIYQTNAVFIFVR